MLGVLRQHELMEAVETANARLKAEIAERLHAEAVVRISETRYRRIFEEAHDGILLIDPASRRITDANPFMSQLLGQSSDEMIGRQLFEIGLLKDARAVREMCRRLKQNHTVRYDDLLLKSRAGIERVVEVVATLYQEDGGLVIQCNIRDITERKVAEDMQRQNEGIFFALIEQSPVGVYVVDAELHLQQANPTAMKLFGDLNPLIGRDFAEIIHILWPKRIADRVTARFRHTLKTGKPYQSPEFTETRQDTGAEETYEWQLQRVNLPVGGYGAVCFFSDVTERRKAENARRDLEMMTASNLKLNREIVRRQAIEDDLQTSKQEQARLLLKSQQQQAQLRDMAHQILRAQEEERKRISRELHDVIAQSLVGISVHVAALAQTDMVDAKSLRQNIARTHRLIEKSVEIVHKFASELRPTMLDDLGLIPALHTYLKNFMAETGIRSSLKSFAGIEKASGALRTALFRIAQESLTNVARHAGATRVDVHIENHKGIIRMQITDDGKGFEVDGADATKVSDRLGLLGMRERIEMLGGSFCVDSAPGKSTTIQVEINAAHFGVRKRTPPKSSQDQTLECS